MDLDCYDARPVPALVAKADVSTKPRKVNTFPGRVHKRATKKPLYRADRLPDVEYPCDSPSLPSAALPVEDEPMGEFTPIPSVTAWITTFEQEVPEVPPTFETASGYVPFGGGGYFAPPGVYGAPVAIPSPVPEPSALWLMGAGLLFLRRKMQ